MAKKQVGVSLRKPPRVEADTFDAGDGATELADTKKQGGLGATVASTAGISMRELVLYLPADVAKKLSLHCASNGLDVSRFVKELIEKELAAPPLTVPVRAPETALERILRLRDTLVALVSSRLRLAF